MPTPTVAEIAIIRAAVATAVRLSADLPPEARPFDRALAVGARVTQKCLERGLITRALPDADTIAFSPPFVVTEEQVDEMVGRAREAVDEVAAELRAG